MLPQLEAPLEKESGGIFDIVTPLFESKVLLPAVPSLKMMEEQLSVWEMFEPMADPLAEIYDDLYGSLCQDNQRRRRPARRHRASSEVTSYGSKPVRPAIGRRCCRRARPRPHVR